MIVTDKRNQSCRFRAVAHLQSSSSFQRVCLANVADKILTLDISIFVRAIAASGPSSDMVDGTLWEDERPERDLAVTWNCLEAPASSGS